MQEFRFQTGQLTGESWRQGTFDRPLIAIDIIEAMQEADATILRGHGPDGGDHKHIRVIGPDGEMRHRPFTAAMPSWK